MAAYIIISGTVDQKKSAFEFEDSAAGAETITNTVDTGHITIIMEETVLLKSSREIDACIDRLAENLRERAYT